ncbi:MAG TPA: hypothetical protein P5232_02240 [Candidatus Moranbacteria bacterium]|nr:hypothetical protein [Candidatus Moranbacteria bacterium]
MSSYQDISLWNYLLGFVGLVIIILTGISVTNQSKRNGIFLTMGIVLILCGTFAGMYDIEQNTQNRSNAQLQQAKDKAFADGEDSVYDYLTLYVDYSKIPVRGKAQSFVCVKIYFLDGKFSSREIVSTSPEPPRY